MKISGIDIHSLPNYLDAARRCRELEKLGYPENRTTEDSIANILLLPGFLRGDPVLGNLGDALSGKQFNVYYPNIKKSDWKNKEGTEHLIRKISETIKRIPKDKPLIILGHSMGGIIAMHLLNDFHTRINGIIQVGSPNAGSSLFDLRRLATNPITQMMRAGRQFDDILIGDVPPTLSIVLQGDYMVPPRSQSGAHIGRPGNRTIHILGGHHGPLIDAPTIDEVCGRVRQFLDSLPPGHHP